MILFLLASASLFLCASFASAVALRGTFHSPTATHTSAGIYSLSPLNASTLVRTLWSRRATPPGTHALAWDGLDDEGTPHTAAPGHTLAARVLAAEVSYTWEGAIGNSVAQTGPRVPKGYSAVHGLSIAGDVAVLCAGYGERVRTMFAFNASAPSAAASFRSLGHMDYHSVYTNCATDGTTAVFFNNNVPAVQSSYYYDNATFAVGYDLLPGLLFDPSVPAVCEHNYTAGGRLSCQDGTGQHCSVMWDGCNGHEQTYSSALDWSQSSLIPTNNSYADAASGIALQPAGQLLLVLHGLAGQLRAFDKSTGARLFTWAAPQLLHARALALSALPGSDSAWSILANGSVCQLRGLSSAAPLAVACPLPPAALLFPDALALSPDGRQLLVTDIAPTSQQVKLFDAASGALLRTYGAAGGYLAPGADPAVQGAQRFYFSPPPLAGAGLGGAGARPSASALAWTSDGASFWVTDHGNRRLLRVAAASGQALDSLSWLLSSYRSAAIAAQPQRVFSNFLEFAVDHALPVGAPGAWALVRNWGAGLNASFYAWDYGVATCDGWAFAGFDAGVVTISDPAGAERTFATVGYHPYGAGNCSDSTVAVVELVVGGSPAAAQCTGGGSAGGGALPPSGGLRLVHVIDARPHAPGSLADSLGTFERDGSLRFARTHSNGSSGEFWQGIFARRPSFDAQGCASWLQGAPSPAAQLLASFNVSANSSQSLMARGSMAQPRMPTTAGGYTAVLDASGGVNGGFHLGAVAAAGSSSSSSSGGAGAGWAWRASPYGTWRQVDNETVLQPGNVSVNLRYIDPRDIDGRFGANSSGTNFAGSIAMADGEHLFYGFYGEGWYQSEANQMLHFHETGLFIGQFGTPAAPYPEGNTIYASPGVAGNTFSPSLVRALGGDGSQHLYILTNEETEHGGVHRWRVDGADSVRFLSVQLERE